MVRAVTDIGGLLRVVELLWTTISRHGPFGRWNWSSGAFSRSTLVILQEKCAFRVSLLPSRVQREMGSEVLTALGEFSHARPSSSKRAADAAALE